MLLNLRFTSLLRRAAAFVAVAPAALGFAQNRLPTSAEIDAYLTAVVRETRIPGVVALVVDADRAVYTGAFGKQNGIVQQRESRDARARLGARRAPQACG